MEALKYNFSFVYDIVHNSRATITEIFIPLDCRGICVNVYQGSLNVFYATSPRNVFSKPQRVRKGDLSKDEDERTSIEKITLDEDVVKKLVCLADAHEYSKEIMPMVKGLL